MTMDHRADFAHALEEQPAAPRSGILVQRVIGKLDEYMSRLDFPGAARHLDFWLREAQASGDARGELTVLNEWIGLDRKSGQRDAALSHIDSALKLLDAVASPDGMTAGTTCINAGTACYVFGDYERSLALFERAKACYEHSAVREPRLMGGLYNNLGLTLTAVGRFDEALAAYREALRWMEQASGTEAERAETFLNMADTLEHQRGMAEAESEIYGLLDRAEALLKTAEAPDDGYFAFVCRQCAPTFGHYGYFAAAAHLQGIADRYYERT